MKKLSNYISACAQQGAATAMVCAKQVLEGGLLRSLSSNFVRLAQYVVFILLWQGFAAAGANLGGFTEKQLLTYTLLSFAVRPTLDIITPATSMLWEGSIVGRYTRPMPLYVTFMAETIGRQWLPFFIFYSVPVVIVSTVLGISPLPASAANGLLFILSIFLSVTIGFALDLLFAAMAIRLKNAVWTVTRIREAIHNLLSGAIIPFALMPAPVAAVMGFLPFGSLASAPLGIYVGAQSPLRPLALQFFWAVTLWPLAHLIYKKSEEGMVSYGG